MRDVTIIGGGGSGYTAGIYTARYGLDPLLISKEHGGMIAENPEVDNFPGYPETVSGQQIMDDMKAQAERLGVETQDGNVQKVLPVDENDLSKGYHIYLESDDKIKSKTVMLGIGTHKRKLGVDGEKEFRGKGVSYCATCDGFFYKDKTVAVVGGSDSAFVEANYLADICEKVYLIHRRDRFRADQVRQDKVQNKENVEVIESSIVQKIQGDQYVSSLELSKALDDPEYPNASEFETQNLDVDGVFIAIGTIPNDIEGVGSMLEKDKKKYIKVGEDQSTSMDGIFAAGDVTNNSNHFRQLVTACSEGAIAAEGILDYVSRN